MTVKELRDILETMPQDLTVVDDLDYEIAIVEVEESCGFDMGAAVRIMS